MSNLVSIQLYDTQPNPSLWVMDDTVDMEDDEIYVVSDQRGPGMGKVRVFITAKHIGRDPMISLSVNHLLSANSEDLPPSEVRLSESICGDATILKQDKSPGHHEKEAFCNAKQATEDMTASDFGGQISRFPSKIEAPSSLPSH